MQSTNSSPSNALFAFLNFWVVTKAYNIHVQSQFGCSLHSFISLYGSLDLKKTCLETSSPMNPPWPRNSSLWTPTPPIQNFEMLPVLCIWILSETVQKDDCFKFILFKAIPVNNFTCRHLCKVLGAINQATLFLKKVKQLRHDFL